MEIQRACMRDQVRDRILARILSGEYPAGTRLKEMVIAADCKVSQAPVREALRELEALGLVECERYRGSRVRSMDAAELREAYELRILIEEAAVQRAVPLCDSRIARLEAEYDRMAAAHRRDDDEAHAEAAIAFHRSLVEASGNRVFLAAWDNLHWEVRTRIAIQRLSSRGVRFDDYVATHRRILDQLRAGLGAEAARGIRELIERIMDSLESTQASPEPANKKPRTKRGS